MPSKQKRGYVTLTLIAKFRGVSIQAVSRFLKRKGVKPVHGGNGPCTHFYDPHEVERAYLKKRPYGRYR